MKTNFTYLLSSVITSAATLALMLFPGLLFADTPTRVSVDSSGTEGNAYSFHTSLSADGRYVAFGSEASNLVAGDTNDVADVFIYDTHTSLITRVSVDSNGTEGDSFSGRPFLSADGRYIVFESDATNLVAGDTNNTTDIFLHDTLTGLTTRVSVDSSGTEADDWSFSPSLSADGRYVGFASEATNLVAGDTNNTTDIFLHDTLTSLTTRVSVDSSGTEGDAYSGEPFFSADGRYIVFTSDATNLVAGDTNDSSDAFLHDTLTGLTTRISVDSNGTEGDNYSFSPFLSADGRYITFVSDATNLVAGDTNDASDVFLHDTLTGLTTRISVDSSGAEADDTSYNSFLSADGRYAIFVSSATNLVAGDTNNVGDVFLHDILTGLTTRVSLDSNGTEGDDFSGDPFFSPDGRYVAFVSDANNLVAGDTNGVTDIFIQALTVETPTATSLTTTSTTPSLTGTWDYQDANTLTVEIDGIATYTLGTDPELTTDDEENWTLALTVPLTPSTYIVEVTNSNIFASDSATGNLLIEPILSSSASSHSSTLRFCTDTVTTFCRPTTSTPVVTPTENNPFNGEQCPSNQLLTNNMKQGDRNGQFSSYNNDPVTEVNILQGHMNRLLLDEYGNQAAGPIDGIYGPLTKRGVERLQQRLNQLLPSMTPLVIDGIVGPFTRSAVNMSC